MFTYDRGHDRDRAPRRHPPTLEIHRQRDHSDVLSSLSARQLAFCSVQSLPALRSAMTSIRRQSTGTKEYKQSGFRHTVNQVLPHPVSSR